MNNKPVLVGLHLGFAILGIDLSLWLLGEFMANQYGHIRAKIAAVGALLAYVMSWIIGGYYYVHFYGAIVKPEILTSSTPWAHSVVMETKEHIFLMIVPLAATLVFLSWLKPEDIEQYQLKTMAKILVGLTAGLGLLIGLMGFVISAAARWA